MPIFCTPPLTLMLVPLTALLGLLKVDCIAKSTNGWLVLLTVTKADAGVVPPLPLQFSKYVVVTVGVTLCVPAVALAPFQPVASPPEATDAVQLSALLVLQLSVVDCPTSMVVGLALKFTTGAGTVTVTLIGVAEPVPPSPLQLNLYVVVVLGDNICEPLVVLVPTHPEPSPPTSTEAVQVLALVLLQVKVELSPRLMAVGTALSVTVGTGMVTVNSTGAADPVPPGPVQLSS